MKRPLSHQKLRKTQIALSYVYWLRNTCPEVSVFWVHGSNVEVFRQSYTSIALECRVPGYDDPKVDVLPLVKEWLERKDQGRWLMVVDNADDIRLFFPSPWEPIYGSGTHQEYLGQYIPECAHGSILVTTRNKQAGLKLTKGKPPIEIGAMSDDESKRLLHASLGELDVASDELLALSHRLEHLPLALAQAAAFIQENEVPVGEYLRLLGESDQSLVYLLSEEFETVGRDSKAPRAVAETWILSFQQIQQQNVFASELLSLMSFFDRQAIPIEFLDYYREQQDQEKGGKIQLQKALGILKSFSFVTAWQDQILDVHRLVQLTSRNWLARENKMNYFAGQALSAISHVYPFGTYENWAICSKYLPHVFQVLKFEGTGSRDEKIRKGNLLYKTATYLFYQGQFKDGERLQLEAAELRRGVLGADHPDTLASLTNLASIFRNQGRWEEAEKLEVQVMEARKTKLGVDHPDMLTIMGNLASTYRNQGRWKEAEALEVQVMETRKTKLGVDHPDTLTSINNLASTYWDQGRWEEAEALFVQVMETSKAKLGADHPDTLTIMGNLASTYRNQGRWNEAESLLMQVMEVRQRVLGQEHPDTLSSINILASIYNKQGRWSKAESLQIQVMEMRQRVLGQEHPDTLSSMNILASIYNNQGRWSEAESLLMQVMEVRQRVLGQEHPDTLSSINILASIYNKQGRWSKAESLQIQVMEMRQRVLGQEHPDTLSSMNILASIYSNQGRLNESEVLQLQLVKGTPDILGEMSLTGTTAEIQLKELKSDSGYASASRKPLTVPSESAIRESIGPVATEPVYDDIQSLTSDIDDIRSQASDETTSEEITGKALIRVYLAEDAQFRELCEKALRKMSRRRFVENMRRLLKSFHKNLSEEAGTEPEKAVAVLLRSRRGRLRISQQLADLFQQDPDETLGGNKADLGVTAGALYSVEKWLEHASGRPANPNEQSSVSEQDVEELSESESGSSDSSDGPEENNSPLTLELKSYLLKSQSFRHLRRELMLMFLPVELKQVLSSVPKEHIWWSSEQDLSFSNRVKACIEDHTQVKWNWWPFEPRKRLLQGDESRMYWQCVRLI